MQHFRGMGSASAWMLSAGLGLAATSAQAVTVNFDDLSTTNVGFPGVGAMPSSYAGLDFSCVDGSLCRVVNASTYGGNPSGYTGR